MVLTLKLLNCIEIEELELKSLQSMYPYSYDNLATSCNMYIIMDNA